MKKPILKKRLEQILAIQWTGNNIDAIREFYNGTVSMWDTNRNILFLSYDSAEKGHEEKFLSLNKWLYFSDATHDFHIISDKEMQLTFS